MCFCQSLDTQAKSPGSPCSVNTFWRQRHCQTAVARRCTHQPSQGIWQSQFLSQCCHFPDVSTSDKKFSDSWFLHESCPTSLGMQRHFTETGKSATGCSVQMCEMITIWERNKEAKPLAAHRICVFLGVHQKTPVCQILHLKLGQEIGEGHE